MGKTCIAVPEIVLPAAGVDMTAWAVIACDQHTSDAAYWEELDRFVGGRPSALRLTLPEIYLSDSERRTAEIERTMREYRARGISASSRPALSPSGAPRRVRPCAAASCLPSTSRRIPMRRRATP